MSADLGGTFQNLVTNYVRSTNTGAYIEPNFELGGGLQVRTGLVGELFGNSGSYLEPRLRVTLDRGIYHLSAAAGIYRQNVIGVNDRRDASSVFTAYAEATTGRLRYGACRTPERTRSLFASSR